MIQNIVVEVAERADRGKNAARRMRREGNVPAIVYGMEVAPFSVTVARRRLEEILKLESGRNTIFTLALAGQDKTRAAMIKSLQRDPVTEGIIHVDFIRVDLEKTVRVNVSIRFLGTPEGVKTEGGVLEVVLRQVEVECLPTDIPEHLDVDVSAMALNDSLSVADLPAGERYRILDDPGQTVCQVAVPRAEEAPAAAEAEAPAAAAAAEPEVIKKGKEAGEGTES
jgi:large subunit ribosomal protein L25